MSSVIASGITAGIAIPNVLYYSGVLIGNRGVAYYAEVHTTALNSYCHTIGMPFFIYGTLLWLPMLVNTDNYKIYLDIQQFFYSAYMTHYILIDATIGLTTSIVYAVPLYYAHGLQ